VRSIYLLLGHLSSPCVLLQSIWVWYVSSIGCVLRKAHSRETDGIPLTLARILSTSLIKGANLPAAVDMSPFGLSPRYSPFPLLSQGDHPVLNTPSWYLHPCETPKAVAELLKEGQISGDEGSRWLRAWFAVLSTVIDLRPMVTG
jgi:ubiquitin-like-conjugating enzyme ATG10